LRVLGEVCFRGSFESELFFGLSFFLPFVGLVVFLFLDDLLKLFYVFWSSSYTSCHHEFKIQTLCLCVVNVLIKGEIEKPSC
jgi:uncharacterized membrane protein